MNVEVIRFVTDDGLWLGGLLYTPKEKTDYAIISVHGAQSACIRIREKIFGTIATSNGFAYFAFNNRSTAILERFNKTSKEGKVERVLYGSANDVLEESISDIRSSIKTILDMGYKKIILLAHCVGCTKVINYLNNEKKTDFINGICLISPSDCINYQKNRLKEKYDERLEYAKNNINTKSLVFMDTEDWVLEITTKTYYDYFNEKSINQLMNYKKDSLLKQWKNLPQNIFICFCGNNEVVGDNVEKILSKMKEHFKDKRTKLVLYRESNHSYFGYEEKVMKDIIDFVKE